MSRLRLFAVFAATTGLTLAVIPSSAVAASQPMHSSVRKISIAGVDAPSLVDAPNGLRPLGLSSSSGPSAARTRTADRPAVLTPPIATERFSAAGVIWSAKNAPTGVVVQMRIRERGAWSAWEALDAEGGPDPGSADARNAQGRVTTEPFLSAGADAVQVRVDSTRSVSPADLSIIVVDPGSSSADARLAPSSVSSPASVVGSPPIVTRAQWGADESIRPPGCGPTYSSTITAGFVHHTVNSNTYSASDSPALVRAIYAFHVQGRGWCDLGYQFLVDRFGTIFEGRAGGVDRPVIGAQAGGFNTNTFGVAGMGDFTSVIPSSTMMDGISRIVGWKLSINDRDPYGTTILTSAGGDSTPYPVGAQVTVKVISGHRDVDYTGCPGDTFYPRLYLIRDQAAAFIAAGQVFRGGAVPSLLRAGGGMVLSPNGAYGLVLLRSGNLIVKDSLSRPVWESGSVSPNGYLAAQSDGNVVVYNGASSPVWALGTTSPGARLVVQDDGNLVLYATSGAALWDSKGGTRRGVTWYSTARTFATLAPEQALASGAGGFRLTMQNDGNLVDYGPDGRPRWATGTFVPGSAANMWSDGNLVVSGPSGVVWSTGTRNANAFPVLQSDGNLVLYAPDGPALWSARR